MEPEPSPMTGGPDDTIQNPENLEHAEPPISEPEVEVTIMGKTLKVSPEMAEILEEREREFNRKLSEQSTELGELRKLREQPPVAPIEPKENEIPPEIIEAWYTDPEKVIKFFKKSLNETSEETAKRVRESIKRETAIKERERKFWNDFYGMNKDLDKPSMRTFVKYVLGQKWPELSKIQDEREAMKALATHTREYLASVMSGKGKGGKDVYAEPSHPEPPKPKVRKEGHIPSLTELLKSRRKRHTKAPKLT